MKKKSLGLRQAYQLCIIYTQELFVMSKKPARRSPLDTQWIPIIPRWIKTHKYVKALFKNREGKVYSDELGFYSDA